MKYKKYAALAALVVCTSGVAHSATIGLVEFNAGTIAIFGGGNPNGNWVRALSSAGVPAASVELRFSERFVGGAENNNGAGTYTFDVGKEINVEFSVGSSSTLDNYVYILVADSDPTSGTSGTPSFPVSLISDNSFGTSVTPNGGGIETTWASGAPVSSVAQNSQQLGFPVLGEYTFSLTAYNASDTGLTNPLARTEATLNVVPEPSSILLGGIGGVGLLFLRRRKY